MARILVKSSYNVGKSFKIWHLQAKLDFPLIAATSPQTSAILRQLGIPFTQVHRGGARRLCGRGREGRQPTVGRGDERAARELVSAGG